MILVMNYARNVITHGILKNICKLVNSSHKFGDYDSCDAFNAYDHCTKCDATKLRIFNNN